MYISCVLRDNTFHRDGKVLSETCSCFVEGIDALTSFLFSTYFHIYTNVQYTSAQVNIVGTRGLREILDAPVYFPRRMLPNFISKIIHQLLVCSLISKLLDESK